jgi:tyrosine-protein phosphatase SIW14
MGWRKIGVKRKTQNIVDFFASRLHVVVTFLATTSPMYSRFPANHAGKLQHRKSGMKKIFWIRLCKSCAAVELFAALSLSALAQSPASQLTPTQISSDVHAAMPQPVRASFGAPAEKMKILGVPNAGKISDSLFRGAQPSPQGLAELKKLGVTTVIDLRGEPGPVAQERAQAEALGLKFIDIPMSGWSAPGTPQITKFLQLLRDDPSQKIFVHCYYGADRTGVMIAAYRIAEQNWTADQAIAEMYSFGFHYHWHPAMKSYVRAFPAKFSGDSAFAALRKPAAPDPAPAAAPR